MLVPPGYTAVAPFVMSMLVDRRTSYYLSEESVLPPLKPLLRAIRDKDVYIYHETFEDVMKIEKSDLWEHLPGFWILAAAIDYARLYVFMRDEIVRGTENFWDPRVEETSDASHYVEVTAQHIRFRHKKIDEIYVLRSTNTVHQPVYSRCYVNKGAIRIEELGTNPRPITLDELDERPTRYFILECQFEPLMRTLKASAKKAFETVYSFPGDHEWRPVYDQISTNEDVKSIYNRGVRH